MGMVFIVFGIYILHENLDVLVMAALLLHYKQHSMDTVCIYVYVCESFLNQHILREILQ